MTRREAVRRACFLMGGAVSAPALAGVLAGCRGGQSTTGYSVRTLDASQHRLVSVVADHIIPETDTPGATSAGVPEFIDLMLTEWYPPGERDAFLSGIAAFDARAEDLFGSAFTGCSVDQQVQLLQEFDGAAYRNEDGADVPFFRTLKELTVLGYYTSETGATRELRWEAYPGRYDGCVPFADVGRAWV